MLLKKLIKAVAEAAYNITQLIDINNNPVVKSKVLSDNELIYKSIYFIRENRYDIRM